MEEDEQRNVFNANLVLDRKALITAVGIDHEGSRVFLGVEEGMLEEYSLDIVDTRPTSSLTARKPIAAKQPILSILPATSANCLALLVGDGSLRLVHSDTLESRVALKGPILAASVALPSQLSSTTSLPKLAVVTRVTMSRALRVSVYDIIPAGGQIPSLKLAWEVDVGVGGAGGGSSSGVICLAWAGESVILGVGTKYYITWQRNINKSGKNTAGQSGKESTKTIGAWRELLSISEDTTPDRSSTSAVQGESPSSTSLSIVAAVSLPRQGCAFISVGSLGLVVSSAGEPRGNPILFQNIPAMRALASGEGVIAVIFEDGIRIADPGTGNWIQGLGFGENLMPVPGQPLHASGGGGSDSSVIVVAGRHKVWAFTPIPVEEQARDMLSRRDFAGALKLAAKGLAEGASWAEDAYAQTALLLMHEGRFLEALVALEHCSPTAFQPSELFPLFPQHTAPWEPHPSPLHWSLSGPLDELKIMINKSPLLRRHRQSRGSTVPGSSNGGNEVVDEERVREATQAIVQYLFRARVLPGVSTIDGVDTLLMHLLIDLDAAQEAAAFAAVVPHAIRPEFVAERLETAGWKHALATLWAATGNAEPALKIWKELSDATVSGGPTEEVENIEHSTLSSTHMTSPSTDVVLRERKEALDGVTSLLQSSDTCSDIHLVLSYIPWLLNVSPADASHVLSSRDDLKPGDILPLLPLGEETRWRYLEHLVLSSSSGNEGVDIGSSVDSDSLHTELAKALIAAIFKAAPELKEERKNAHGDGESESDGQQQRTAVARHRSVLPNVLPIVQTHNINGKTTNINDSRDASTSTPPPPPLSVAALVSGMRPPNPQDAVDAIESLRFRLRTHLETSSQMDCPQILSLLQGSSLLEESAVVHWRLGDHKAVLRVLAVALRDVNAAVCYASVYLPPEDHRMLLHLLLNPEGAHEEPRWEDACRVVALLGSSLDSLEVVRAAPEGMPMPAAVALMAPLLRERVHRRRNGQLTAALQRSRAAAGGLALAAVEGQNVVVDDGRACPDCHLRLGGKVFVVVQQHQNEGKKGGKTQQVKQQQETSLPPKAFCLSCWNKREKARNQF